MSCTVGCSSFNITSQKTRNLYKTCWQRRYSAFTTIHVDAESHRPSAASQSWMERKVPETVKLPETEKQDLPADLSFTAPNRVKLPVNSREPLKIKGPTSSKMVLRPINFRQPWISGGSILHLPWGSSRTPPEWTQGVAFRSQLISSTREAGSNSRTSCGSSCGSCASFSTSEISWNWCLTGSSAWARLLISRSAMALQMRVVGKRSAVSTRIEWNRIGTSIRWNGMKRECAHRPWA